MSCCRSSCCPISARGPAAYVLGGIDLGWLVGLLVSGALYLWLSRSAAPARQAQAIRESARLLWQPD